MYIMHMVHEESEQKKKNAKKVVKKLGGRQIDVKTIQDQEKM